MMMLNGDEGNPGDKSKIFSMQEGPDVNDITDRRLPHDRRAARPQLRRAWFGQRSASSPAMASRATAIAQQ